MIRKIILYLLAIILFLPIVSAFAGGDGSIGNPFQISNCQELQNTTNNTNASYILINDIDCNVSPFNAGSGFSPISNFSGNFNGQGNKIKGLYINLPVTNRIGLFKAIESVGFVHSMGLVDVNIIGASNTGALTGRNLGRVERIFVKGKISCSAGVGGLVGVNLGEIRNTNSHGDVIGVGASIGGLVGLNIGNISESYSASNVQDSGRSTVGGLVGLNLGTISRSFSTGNVSDVNDTGGFVGLNSGMINNSYYSNTVNNPDVCIRNDISNLSVSCTLISNNDSYFYDGTNEPMINWIFVSIWFDAPRLPELIFQFPFDTCGNFLLESGEQCDDGNIVNGDGCDASCQIEVPEQRGVCPIPPAGQLTIIDGKFAGCTAEQLKRDALNEWKNLTDDLLFVDSKVSADKFFEVAIALSETASSINDGNFLFRDPEFCIANSKVIYGQCKRDVQDDLSTCIAQCPGVTGSDINEDEEDDEDDEDEEDDEREEDEGGIINNPIENDGIGISESIDNNSSSNNDENGEDEEDEEEDDEDEDDEDDDEEDDDEDGRAGVFIISTTCTTNCRDIAEDDKNDCRNDFENSVEECKDALGICKDAFESLVRDAEDNEESCLSACTNEFCKNQCELDKEIETGEAEILFRSCISGVNPFKGSDVFESQEDIVLEGIKDILFSDYVNDSKVFQNETLKIELLQIREKIIAENNFLVEVLIDSLNNKTLSNKALANFEICSNLFDQSNNKKVQADNILTGSLNEAKIAEALELSRAAVSDDKNAWERCDQALKNIGITGLIASPTGSVINGHSIATSTILILIIITISAIIIVRYAFYRR